MMTLKLTSDILYPRYARSSDLNQVSEKILLKYRFIPSSGAATIKSMTL